MGWHNCGAGYQWAASNPITLLLLQSSTFWTKWTLSASWKTWISECERVGIVVDRKHPVLYYGSNHLSSSSSLVLTCPHQHFLSPACPGSFVFDILPASLVCCAVSLINPLVQVRLYPIISPQRKKRCRWIKKHRRYEHLVTISQLLQHFNVAAVCNGMAV